MDDKELLPICHLKRSTSFSVADIPSENAEAVQEAIGNAIASEVSNLIMQSAKYYVRPSLRQGKTFRK